MLPNEDQAPLQANLAKRLLVVNLQMSLKCLKCMELMELAANTLAVGNEAMEGSKFGGCCFDFVVLIVNILIVFVIKESFLLLDEPFIVDMGRLSYNDLVQLCLANRTLHVLHDKSKSKQTGLAYVLVVALAYSEVSQIIETKDAVLSVGKVNIRCDSTLLPCEFTILHCVYIYYYYY